MALEQLKLNRRVAQELWKDIDFLSNAPLRLMFMFFERDQWRPNSISGRKLLRAFLQTFADNKVVEDMHHKVRQDCRGNANRVQRIAHIQDVANNSGTLEGRGILHPAALTKEVWVRNFRTASARSRKK
eukprot:4854082-Lingulodinium_polyedra.AAC.1